MRVRPAEPRDLEAVSRLAAALVRAHHAYDAARFLLVEPIEEGYRHFFAGELRRKRTVILVAERTLADEPETEGGILGYAYGSLEGRNWNDLLDACGKVNDLFVAEAARRRGIARALMTEMLRVLQERGAPRVVLLSAWQNGEAHRFFETLGFRRTMLEMTRESDG